MSGRTRARGPFAVLMAGALATGCYTTYESRGQPVPFGEESVVVLRPGRTTRHEVLALFGAPTDVTATLTGESFRYSYEKRSEEGVDVGVSALFGLLSLSVFRTETGHRDQETLTLLFDGQGVLEMFSYSPSRRGAGG